MLLRPIKEVEEAMVLRPPRLVVVATARLPVSRVTAATVHLLRAVREATAASRADMEVDLLVAATAGLRHSTRTRVRPRALILNSGTL